MNVIISNNTIKTLSIGCIIMALSSPVFASGKVVDKEYKWAGYKILGDEKNGFHCVKNNTETVRDLTMKHLNLAVSGYKDFAQIATEYETVMHGRVPLFVQPSLNFKSRSFKIKNKYTKKNMRPQMYTKVTDCKIIKYAVPKTARVISEKSPVDQKITFKEYYLKENKNTVSIATSSTSSMQKEQTKEVNLGFEYGPVSGGASVSETNTSAYSLTTDFEQTTEVSSEMEYGKEMEINVPRGEFFGRAPSSKQISYEVEITFQTRFEGSVLFDYNTSDFPEPVAGFRKVPGGFEMGLLFENDINLILDSKVANDTVNRPPKFTSTKTITTIVNRVLSRGEVTYESFVNEEKYNKNLEALKKNKFKVYVSG
jgi:hypothetical protein